MKLEKSNAVSFGRYAILLEQEQLIYYVDGELTKILDVSCEFDHKDLFNLAERIALKKKVGPAKFILKEEIKRMTK